MNQYPRIIIKFCTKCKWTLRATWYQSELFQTFSSEIGEISLQPSESGTFQIITFSDAEDQVGTIIWDRVADGGFPDSKILKRRVRDILFTQENLGHVDRIKEGEDGLLKSDVNKVKKICENQEECQECKEPEQSCEN